MNPDEITIRPAQLADAAMLPAIERSAALLYGEIEGFADCIDSPVIDQITHARWMSDGAYLIAECGAGRHVGFLAARPIGNRGLIIHDIAVRRAFQSRGIGKALVDRALGDARNRRIGELWVKADLHIPWVASLCASAGLHTTDESEISPLALELGSQDPRTPDRQAWRAVWLHRPLAGQAQTSASSVVGSERLP